VKIYPVPYIVLPSLHGPLYPLFGTFVQVEDGSDPTSDLGTDFAGLDAATKRQTDKDKGNFDQPGMTKYMQDGWTVAMFTQHI